jgi:large-conductance mechanosensitive channel
MRAWSLFIVRNRLLDIALAVALGIAAYEVVRKLSEAGVTALAQHVGRYPGDDDGTGLLNLLSYGPYNLYVEIAGTYVVYGQVLVGAIAFGLVALAGVFVIRARKSHLGECPFCASRIPYESTHCAYCGSSVSAETP